MNSVNSFKRYFFILLVVSTSLLADAVPFSVAGPQLPSDLSSKDMANAQNKMLSELKVQAVSEWLQGYLGQRFPQYEKSVTSDFAEKYVLDYSVGRTSTNPPMVVLNGHLDADALKRWIRLSETKHRGSSQLRTLLFMSSNIPGISFTASETASKVREITIASTLYGLLTPQFQQLNARLELANGGAPAGAAPRNSEEAKDLKDFANRDGLNTAAWAQFTSCASCGGARLDLFAYSLSTHRVVVAVSEDLNLSPSSYANPEYLKTVLAPITQQFKTELESAVTDGRLFASEFRLIIEGLDSYRQFKTIEQGLTRQDFISQPVVRRAAPRTAEFEFLSTLGMDELIQRFPQTEIGGFRLRPGRVDDSTLAARLGK